MQPTGPTAPAEAQPPQQPSGPSQPPLPAPQKQPLPPGGPGAGGRRAGVAPLRSASGGGVALLTKELAEMHLPQPPPPSAGQQTAIGAAYPSAATATAMAGGRSQSQQQQTQQPRPPPPHYEYKQDESRRLTQSLPSVPLRLTDASQGPPPPLHLPPGASGLPPHHISTSGSASLPATPTAAAAAAATGAVISPMRERPRMPHEGREPHSRSGSLSSGSLGGGHQLRVCMFTMPQSCVLPLELRPYAHLYATASGYPYFDPLQLQGGGTTSSARTRPNPLLGYGQGPMFPPAPGHAQQTQSHQMQHPYQAGGIGGGVVGGMTYAAPTPLKPLPTGGAGIGVGAEGGGALAGGATTMGQAQMSMGPQLMPWQYQELRPPVQPVKPLHPALARHHRRRALEHVAAASAPVSPHQLPQPSAGVPYPAPAAAAAVSGAPAARVPGETTGGAAGHATETAGAKEGEGAIGNPETRAPPLLAGRPPPRIRATRAASLGDIDAVATSPTAPPNTPTGEQER